MHRGAVTFPKFGYDRENPTSLRAVDIVTNLGQNDDMHEDKDGEERVSTGVEGLDLILGGGFLPRGFYLLREIPVRGRRHLRCSSRGRERGLGKRCCTFRSPNRSAICSGRPARITGRWRGSTFRT